VQLPPLAEFWRIPLQGGCQRGRAHSLPCRVGILSAGHEEITGAAGKGVSGERGAKGPLCVSSRSSTSCAGRRAGGSRQHSLKGREGRVNAVIGAVDLPVATRPVKSWAKSIRSLGNDRTTVTGGDRGTGTEEEQGYHPGEDRSHGDSFREGRRSWWKACRCQPCNLTPWEQPSPGERVRNGLIFIRVKNSGAGAIDWEEARPAYTGGQKKSHPEEPRWTEVPRRVAREQGVGLGG
jgi:hypothetical protein